MPRGVQGLDRYAYVRNSPLKYTDPSGHNPECGPDGVYCGGGQWIHPRYPDKVDPKRLTKTSSQTGLGGQQMYELYLQLWADQDGWWWDAFGSSQGFSIWDFMSTFAYYEAGGHTNWASTMAEGGVRWYFGATKGDTDKTSILNWWGAFSQSAAEAYKAGPGYSLPLNDGDTATDAGAFGIFGNSFANPPSEWKKGWAADRPYGWANLYGYYLEKPNPIIHQDLLVQHGNALFVDFGSKIDRDNRSQFIIPSGCAWATGYNLWYGNVCNSVTRVNP